jgi:hypothetical protein
MSIENVTYAFQNAVTTGVGVTIRIICFTMPALAKLPYGISITTFLSAARSAQLLRQAGAWWGREFRLARILDGRAGSVARLLTLI